MPTSLAAFVRDGVPLDCLLDTDYLDGWRHLFRRALISEVMYRLVLVFADSAYKLRGCVDHVVQDFQRVERLYAVRNGYDTTTRLCVGLDLKWRVNMGEKSCYFDAMLDFKTVSAFSAVADIILMNEEDPLFLLDDEDEDDADDEYTGPPRSRFSSEVSQYRPWLAVLHETGTLSGLEFRTLSSGFDGIASAAEWSCPVVVDGGAGVDGRCIVPYALHVARRACIKAMLRRRVQVRLLVVAVMLATYRHVRERRYAPGGGGFLEARRRFYDHAAGTA